MTADQTLQALRDARVIAVIRADDPGTAIRTAEALLPGGITAIELTFTTPDVEQAMDRLAIYADTALIGLGTITTPEQAVRAAQLRAAFLVSPGCPPGLTDAMLHTGITTIAGCLTPTEILTAHQQGAHAIKIFPASVVGPRYLSDLRGPFPDLHAIPTGGIAATDIPQWLDAGALAVGIGGQLARPVHNAHDHRSLVAAARALQTTPHADTTPA